MSWNWVLQIDEEIPAEEILVVNDHERGIQNLVIDCEDEVLVARATHSQTGAPAPGSRNAGAFCKSTGSSSTVRLSLTRKAIP